VCCVCVVCSECLSLSVCVSVFTYSWTQTSGTGVTLSDATDQQPTFEAPDITVTEDLIFDLIVTDPQGLADTDSVTIEITFVP